MSTNNPAGEPDWYDKMVSEAAANASFFYGSGPSLPPSDIRALKEEILRLKQDMRQLEASLREARLEIEALKPNKLK